MSEISKPHNSLPYADLRTTVTYLPIELTGGAHDKFWLIAIEKWRFENDKEQVSRELRIRCRDCNWGYNSMTGFVTVENLVRIGQSAQHHVGVCTDVGRTLPLDSVEIFRVD